MDKVHTSYEYAMRGEEGEFPMPQAKSKAPAPPKDTKVQLRLRPDQKEIITRAARLQQTTVSNFVLENACKAAEQLLAERVQFVLPPDRWQAFCQALDAPPRVRPALKKLLTEASVFDDAGATAAH